MAEIEEGTEGQISDPSEEGQSAENPSDEEGAGSPPAQQEDWQAKIREVEDKLARQEERARYLEQTNQVLERFASQSRQQPESKQGLSPEMQELKRTLSPLFSEELGPLQQSLAAQTDAADALRLEIYLGRKHPEILDDENAYNRTVQQIEQVRQQAAQVYGKYLSRIDAFLYVQGLETVNEKSKSRKSKKDTQVREEAKRQLQNAATRSGEGQPEAKRVPGADIDSIRRRMMAGEKLTPEEKQKFRNHLANAKF